jgi:hypothetical protein
VAEIRRVLGVTSTQKGFSTLAFLACILGVALLILGVLMTGPAYLSSLDVGSIAMLGAGVIGKQHGNTLWLADQGHGNALIQMARVAVREHGMPPVDSDVAAAHEAGHVVVGLAMGGAFGDAFILCNSGRWEGFSMVTIPGVHSKEDCNIFTNPRRGWLLGLQRAGGIHGEILIGRYHPASSIDEAFIMNSLAHGLGNLFGVSMEWVAASLSIASMRVISANMDAFEIVRTALLANKVLTAAEAAALPITQFTHDELVPEWLVQTTASFKSKSAGRAASGRGAKK